MAYAREYSKLTGGLHRELVSMVEKAAVRKRKGEGLAAVVDESRCYWFARQQLEVVREACWLDGQPERAITLVGSTARYPEGLQLTLQANEDAAAGRLAAKKWGGKLAGRRAAGEQFSSSSSRRGDGEDRRNGKAVGSRVLEMEERRSGKAVVSRVLETERTLRAPREAAVEVRVRESERRVGRRVLAEASEENVRLTAEEIFRESGGPCWLDEDKSHVYCNLKQSFTVDPGFSWQLACIQIHLHGYSKIPML